MLKSLLRWKVKKEGKGKIEGSMEERKEGREDSEGTGKEERGRKGPEKGENGKEWKRMETSLCGELGNVTDWIPHLKSKQEYELF